ncbi:hypothetical protein DCAR_0101635 [Daucus carota subsp. sativus]|uniref:Acyl-[acyl-carrier-protein] hydrolase n=1 Tax=Daucus carota subsp. sativus TaxID=79200 RepID=A0AAF1AJG3_DAUCS|nr:hypothetical protein DCAR_0101635 [Daucus carota subsp. sativus]
MFFGSVGSCMHGAALSVFFILFGRMIDLLGHMSSDPHRSSLVVSKVWFFSMDMLYLFKITFDYNHSQIVGFSTDGFSTTTTMRRLNLIWVTARMHIEVYKYPAWSDVVEIETWGHSEGRIGTRRVWIIRDYSNGEVIGRATSKWVMMHQDSRRFQKVSDEVRDEYLEDNYILKKISKLEDPATFSSLGLAPRRVDLDMNQHVNNFAYIGWILESIPQDVINTHELQTSCCN